MLGWMGRWDGGRVAETRMGAQEDRRDGARTENMVYIKDVERCAR